MKNFKSLFAAAALTVAISGAAHAAPTLVVPASPDISLQRTFAFTANAQTSRSNYGNGINFTSLGGDDTLTTVTVDPYFYVIGNLGGSYNVKGWGSGTQTFDGTQQLDIYHNKSYNALVSNLAGINRKLSYTSILNPNGVNGSASALDVKPDIKNTYTTTSEGTYGDTDTKDITTSFYLTGGIVGYQHPSTTGGHVTVKVKSKITIAPGTTAGVYTANPTVTFGTL